MVWNIFKDRKKGSEDFSSQLPASQGEFSSYELSQFCPATRQITIVLFQISLTKEKHAREITTLQYNTLMIYNSYQFKY